MKKALSTLLLLGSLASAKTPPLPVNCEWADAPQYKHTHTVGAAAGVTSGLGFSYRYWGEKNGFQLTLLPMISRNDDSEHTLVSAGASYLRALWSSPLYDFFHQPSRNLVYAYGGLHYFYESTKDSYAAYSTAQYYREELRSHDIYAGGGLGLQMNLSAVQLSLGIGYAASMHKYRSHYGDAQDYMEDQNNLDLAIHPAAEASLGYTFGW